MTALRQPPVWSPVTGRAILSGILAEWFGSGSEARSALEARLREAHSSSTAYLSDSGTSALTVALKAAWALTRAPVALPAYGCYDLATAADGAGVPFILYDLKPATLSPDLESLQAALTGGARCIVVVHLFGVPIDIRLAQELGARYGAWIIEDAAQASGCEYGGRPAGSHGALGVLSFGRGKGVTGGSGGALLVNDARLSQVVEAEWQRAVGGSANRGGSGALARIVAQWLLARPGWYAIPASLPFLRLGETTYRRPRRPAGISALAAGVLCHTLALAPGEVERRRARAAALESASPGKASTWVVPTGWKAGWLRYPVVLPDTAAKELPGHLLRAGVVRGYPQSLAELAGFGARRLNSGAAFPGARLLAERLVTVPTHRFVRGAAIPAF